MAYMKKRKYSSKRKYTTKRKYKRTRTTLAAKVKSIVRRTMETKRNQNTPAVQTVFQTISDTSVFNLIPAITQGTGQGDRIGNSIKPTKFVLKLVIFCNNMNGVYVGASSSYFDIYIFKYKGANQYGGAPNATDMAKFLQNDNSADAYNGQVLDGIRPLNTDLFTPLI